MPAMSQARQIAFDILQKVHQGHHPLDHWLDAAEPRLRTMPRADRALVHAIVYGCLRWQARLDYIIDRSCRNPAKIDLRVRSILRLALFQLYHLDRIPARAVVHSAVEMAKTNKLRWAAGFINGMLRGLTAEPRASIDWPDWEKSPDKALAVRRSFPQWLAKRWIDRFGVQEARALCDAVNQIPAVTIRANRLKTDRPSLMEAIRKEARHLEPTRYAPDGLVLSAFERPLPQWPAFREGWFQVQDEAAQLVAHLVAPQPGETIWDACAGLGTKTAHLAQLMCNNGTLWATDQQAAKLERLQSEMQRLGVSIVRHQPMDLINGIAENQMPRFDRILVDAPCTGLGVLQKNPDGKWNVSCNDLQRSHHRQLSILNCVASCLRPGGILVYSVCSMEPEENEQVVEDFLRSRDDFALSPFNRSAVWVPDTFFTLEGYLRTFPHRHGMDGFFAAAFIKKPHIDQAIDS
jgi:16S rRNA (cytosine967-C5)-methyltransferase